MLRIVIAFCVIFIFAAPYAFAENSVVIDQVGGGKVIVKQSGDDNSVQITQKKTDSHENDEPYLSVGERARVNSVIEKQNPAQDDEKNNKIDVKQSGKNNSATLLQSGDDNDLLLKQDGKNNRYKKSQTGKHNHSKVLQNGGLIEKEDN